MNVSLLFNSDIEERLTTFSKDQTEYHTQNMSSFFSQPPMAVTSETGGLFTKLKEEPEDLTILAPNAGDSVVTLNFGKININVVFSKYSLLLHALPWSPFYLN